MLIYKSEADMPLKRTKPTFETVYPTNFDKLNLDLTLDVFNNKTVAVLKEMGCKKTAKFVQPVTIF